MSENKRGSNYTLFDVVVGVNLIEYALSSLMHLLVDSEVLVTRRIVDLIPLYVFIAIIHGKKKGNFPPLSHAVTFASTAPLSSHRVCKQKISPDNSTLRHIKECPLSESTLRSRSLITPFFFKNLYRDACYG